MKHLKSLMAKGRTESLFMIIEVTKIWDLGMDE